MKNVTVQQTETTKTRAQAIENVVTTLGANYSALRQFRAGK